jgi:hypothetical protein
VSLEQANKHYYEVIYNKGYYIGTQTEKNVWPLMRRDTEEKIGDVTPSKYPISNEAIEKYERMAQVKITEIIEDEGTDEDEWQSDNSERGVAERNAEEEEDGDEQYNQEE